MVQKVQLKNGMTVLKNLQTKSPVVSLQVWVDNGSADETIDVAGVSHFIEHLVFKGTKSFGPGQIAQAIEGAGGQLNAYTSFDQTVYYVTMGASHLELGLKALSEMLFFPLFDKDEIDREREVVIEEIKRGRDEPSRVNSQFAFESFFKTHPYGRPIIGYEEVIQTITAEKIKKYFFEKYHPEKSFLLVTGDFDQTQADLLINKYFNIETKVKAARSELIPLNYVNELEFKSQITNFEETSLNLYWPCADLTSKDYICLEILALILGQGESSFFYKTLKLEQSVVKNIGCYAYSLKQPGIFAINFKPVNGKEVDALKAFFSGLKNYAKSGIEVQDFEKAIVNFKSDIFYSMETCDGIARMIGQNYFYLKDENYVDTYLALLDQIKVKDIEHAFQKYLINNQPKLYVSTNAAFTSISHLENVYIENQISKYKISPSEVNLNTVPLIWNKKRTTSDEIQTIKLSNGARIFLKPQNDTPVIQMDMAFLGGEKIDFQDGVLSLLAQKCWARETKNLTEAELVFEFDKIASSHSAFSGKHSLGFQATTLSPYFERVMDLNFQMLVSTKVSQQIIDRDHSFLVQQYQNRKDNPAQMAFQEFMNQMFKGHYYEQDSLKTLSLSPASQSKDLDKFIQSHFDPKNLVVTVVGDIDVDQTVKYIENGLQNLKTINQPIVFTPYSGLKKDTSYEINIDKEQAQIVFGFQGLKYSDHRRPILSVIQSILSGQGGRLFLELRDKASLAYTVSPIRMEGQEAGYFGSYIACDPTKKEKAIKMMKEEFEKLCSDLVTEEEMNAAKNSLIGRAEIALQRNSEICEKMLFDSIYGLPYDHYKSYPAKIKSVTSQDVKSLISELYSGPKILVTLG